MSSIFLSYAGIDRPAATRIKNGLQAAGAPMIWQDTDQIKVGDNWIDVLQRTLEDCSAYVILVGTGGIHRWVKAELSYALKRHYDSDGQFPIYPLLLPGVVPEKDLPPFLSLIQAQTLASLTPDPTEFQHLAERLQVASEQAETESITPIVSPIVSNTCPWPGLESFDEDTARFYFGRQQETAEALALFGSTQDGVYRRWLQIDGPSGVGKSSLAKAGLLPAIRRGWVEARGGSDPKGWLIAVMRPGADPVFNLAEALKVLPGAPDLGERVHKLRGDDPDALRYLLREYTPAKQRFLLLVDQLEELFTLVEDPAQQRRFDALLNAVLRDQDGGFHLITTIRSDFMTRFSALPKLETLLNERAARYYLKPVTETGLRDAIRTPARLGGLGWDVAKLPDRIFDDAQENSISLPLVSYCLQQLWEKRSSDNKLLDSVYYDLGGVGGALAHSADEVLNSFDKTGRDRARQLLLALVKVNRDGAANTRRRISRDDALTAAGGGPQAEHILMRLSGGVTPEGSNKPSPRLLMVPSKEAGDEQSPAVVELAHEALLTRWETLKNWTEQYRDQLQAGDDLENAARQWHEHGAPRLSGLASGKVLTRYLSAFMPSEMAQEYLKCSKQLRWVRRGAYGVVALVLGGVLAFVVWIHQHSYTPLQGLSGLLAKAGYLLYQPELVQLEAGKFLHQNEDGQSVWLDITEPFSIGRYEVTFEEYDTFAVATGRRLPNDAGWGRGRQPVININWNEAVAYTTWLSVKKGKICRLPTEDEWEYAVLASSEKDYGKNEDDEEITQENLGEYAWYWENSGGQAHKVGTRLPNAWELYDMLGNVWEWTSSFYDEDKSTYVLRGGAWFNDPVPLRASVRFGLAPDARYGHLGFRVVFVPHR